MFTPRKNRNIRKKVEVGDDEPATLDQASITLAIDTPSASETVAKPKKVKKKVTSTALSFGDEEEASEETFKIKKRSTSGKLALSKGKDESILDQPVNATTNRSYSKEALDELRKSTLSTTPSSRSFDVTGGDLVEEKFPTHLGGSTVIPDAKAIHLAKKKREQMRLRNDREEEEFISLAGGDDNTIMEEKNTRLIREEDDEMDDGEADLENVLGEKLELGSRAERQAQKIKRNARKELIENMDEDEEDEEETREWEMQQIRNAGIEKKDRKKNRAAPTQKGIAFPTVTQIPSTANVRRRLQDHLENLKSQHSQHTTQLEQIRREKAGIVLRTADSDSAMSKASARYTFFQELRSYCRNLAAFFEEKFPELEAIERDYRTMLSERTKLVVERRGRDLRDELAEFANVVDDEDTSDGSKGHAPPEIDEFGRSVGVDPQAARKRRKADRERRQAQRKQAHAESNNGAQESNKSTEDYDGLSTDDELGAGDDRELGEAVMELEDRRVNIFKEVGPEFRTIEAVKRHFQAWKTEYPKDYNKAYGGLLLPMVFDFFVRQETCLWNPLRVNQDISEQSWHQAVSSYTIVHSSASHMHSGYESDRDEEEEEEDMDKELMNKVVAKSLCPKITQFLAAGGVDLYSAKQSRCLKAILDQLLDYVDKKDSKMDKLLSTTLQVILQTAQAHRDQFVEAAQPLTPRHILSTQEQQSRERYLWKTIGLFRNLMLLRRLVPAGSIDTLVVDGLLHDCILRLLEGDDKDTVIKYQMIYQALPHDVRSQERHLIIDRMAQKL
ncbi:GC-rich sequence DNA-binding factor [Mortierella sp. AM989]|nr:GC-rich sequence DNA-binding factor [Mortierella sp. AM989]